jgi:hypothetical protein
MKFFSMLENNLSMEYQLYFITQLKMNIFSLASYDLWILKFHALVQKIIIHALMSIKFIHA